MSDCNPEPCRHVFCLVLYNLLVLQFISGDVYGVMCWTFCDFGDEFEVVDTDGEEPKDAFISSITKVDI